MSRTKIISCLTIAIALLITPKNGVLAQSLGNIQPTEINQLSTPQQLIIPPIKPSEITTTLTGNSVSSEGDLLTPPVLNSVITREFPQLWQMRVPLDEVGSLYATYEVKAENGRNNAFSSEQRSDSAVKIVLEPLPITEISRDSNSKTALVQGGVRLKIDFSTAQLAGEYSGDLTVTVNRR